VSSAERKDYTWKRIGDKGFLRRKDGRRRDSVDIQGRIVERRQCTLQREKHSKVVHRKNFWKVQPKRGVYKGI